MIARAAASLAALALLAACGSDAAPQQSAGGSGAEGEVEGGTISDAMLPLESVTSQSPSRGGDDGEAAGDSDEDGDRDGDATEGS